MTKDKLMKLIDAYAEGKLIRDWVESSVDQYTEAILKQPPVSPAMFGIFSFTGEMYVGYWNSKEAAEKVLYDEYNDDDWYVGEMVCQG